MNDMFYYNGLPFPSPGDLTEPEIEPGSPALEADALTSEPGSQQIVENSERYGNTRPLYLPPEKSVCRSGGNS